MEEHEASGAVGVFDHAGAEAHLAEEGGLLVARHARHGHGRGEDAGGGLAADAAGVHDRGQHGAGHAEGVEEFVVPFAGVDVEHEGARGV